METNVTQKEYKYGLSNVLLYIMSGLGLINIIGILCPLINISYINQYIDFGMPNHPSLINIMFCGIMSDSKYRILFIALSVVLLIAALLSIIFFIITVIKRNKSCVLAVIASAVLFLFSFSACVIFTLCFAGSITSFGFKDLLSFVFSIVIPVGVMKISAANIALAVIAYEEKHPSFKKI